MKPVHVPSPTTDVPPSARGWRAVPFSYWVEAGPRHGKLAPAILLEAPRDSGEEESASPPVVFVEDSPEDFEAVRRTLRHVGFAQPLRHFEDGDGVLAYLRSLATSQQPLPPAVVLDLNLPGTDGREVLEEIRSDARLRTLPVVVLTTSQSPDDVAHCQRLGVESYMVKPVHLDELRVKLAHLRDYLRDGTPLPSDD